MHTDHTNSIQIWELIALNMYVYSPCFLLPPLQGLGWSWCVRLEKFNGKV